MSKQETAWCFISGMLWYGSGSMGDVAAISFKVCGERDLMLDPVSIKKLVVVNSLKAKDKGIIREC